MIETIRERFLNEYQSHPQLYHEIDVNRVREDNWQIERFIDSDCNEDTAYNSLIKAMKWKKSFGVHERSDRYFPKEMFELNKSDIYGRDREGRVICWASGKYNYRFPENQDLFFKFTVNLMEKLDTKASKDGYIMVLDTCGMGLANVYLYMTKLLTQILI